MSRSLRIAGFALASLTIVTVALAQQSGDTSRTDIVPAVVAADEGKARLSRSVETRRALTDCPAGVCDTPPKGVRTAHTENWAQHGCGSDGMVARDRNGKAIRRICQSL